MGPHECNDWADNLVWRLFVFSFHDEADIVLTITMATMTAEAATGDAVKPVVATGNGRGAEGVTQAIPSVVMLQHDLLDACKARHARIPAVIVSDDTDPGLP